LLHFDKETLAMEATEEEQALLLKASAEGDVATVRALLERGGLDVDGRDAVRFIFLGPSGWKWRYG
jgi:hypothetical protein